MLDLLRRRIFENPVVGRHLCATFTGPRLGAAVLLICGALTITYLGIFGELAFPGPTWYTGPAGSLLWYACACVLYLALVLFVPLKVSGSIEGARFGKAFDQLVVTGVSPLRIAFGSWSIGLFYALVLLVATSPFAGCAWLFDGVTAAQIVRTYLTLLLYTNVILGVTLAFAVFEREWLSTPLVIAGFGLLGLFAWIPESSFAAFYPPHLAELTPIRIFWRDIHPYDVMGRFGAMGNAAIARDVWIFGVGVSVSVWPWIIWSGIIAFCFWLIACGPNHRFVPGLNNFGAVVLPGDNRRRIFRNLRPALTRRVEIAFLYENRAPFFARWEVPGKILVSIFVAVGFWGVVQGLIYAGSYAPNPRGIGWDEHWQGTRIASLLGLGVWILFWTDPNVRVYWREPVGRASVPRELLLSAAFLVLLGTYLGVHSWTIEKLHETATGPTGTFTAMVAQKDDRIFEGHDPESLGEDSDDSPAAEANRAVQLGDARFSAYAAEADAFGLSFVLFAAGVFLTSRIVSRGTASFFFNRIVVVIYTLGALLVPPGLFALAREFPESVPRWIESTAAFSPLFTLDDVVGRVPGWTPEDRVSLFWLVHGSWVLFLLGWLLLLHWARSRRVPRRRRETRSSAPVAAGLLAGVTVLAGVFGSRDARAQVQPPPSTPSAPLVIESTTRGFEGRIFSPAADFLTLVVRNPGDEEVRGTLRISTGMWEGDTTPEPFVIGPGTTRLIRLDIRSRIEQRYFRSYHQQLAVVFETEDDRVVSSPRVPVELVATDSSPSDNEYETPMMVRQSAGEDSLRGRELRHAYVYSGTRTARPPQEWSDAALQSEPRRFAACDASTFPEHAQSYEGLTALFLASSELAALGEAQRRALFDWVRLGGTAVFFGPLDEKILQGADLWTELLHSERAVEREIGSILLRSEELSESTVLFDLSDAGGVRFPLLRARSAGCGYVAHLAFDPGHPELPLGIDAKRFFRELSRRLPASTFPLFPSFQGANRRGDSQLRDVSGMGFVFAYLAIYALVISLVLGVGLRKRERRRLVLPVIAGGAVAGLASLPVLDHCIHGSPSYSEAVEMTFTRPGASFSVTAGAVGVRSSGRQRHEIAIEGSEAAAWMVDAPLFYYAGIPRSVRFDPMLLSGHGPAGSESAALSLRVPPWSRRDLYAVRTNRGSFGVEGEAELVLGFPARNSATKHTLIARARLPQGVAPEGVTLVAPGLMDASKRMAIALSPANLGANGSEVTFRHDVNFVTSDDSRVFAVDLGGDSTAFLNWPPARTPAVCLVWEVDSTSSEASGNPALARATEPLVRSDDLAFERRISPLAIDPEIAASSHGASRDSEGWSLHLRRRFVVVELPLVVR